VTLGIAIVFPQIVLKFSSWTGGGAGLATTAELPGPSGITAVAWNYWVLLIICIVVFALAWSLVHSRTGRAMVAVRDQEIASRTLGVDIKTTKIAVYAATAALAGVAGWMFAVVNQFVAPADFSMLLSINLILGMVVGGASSVFIGPVVGAALLVYMREWVPSIGFDALLTPFIYGVLLILVLRLLPGGAAGAVSNLVGWVRRRDRADPDIGPPRGPAGPTGTRSPVAVATPGDGRS
jgi:branched-chain amino acid transport system permease protein